MAVDLMTASGEIMHISKEENSEFLPAVVLSLGALGIILNVTLQCEPAYNLQQKQFPAPLKDVSSLHSLFSIGLLGCLAWHPFFFFSWRPEHR